MSSIIFCCPQNKKVKTTAITAVAIGISIDLMNTKFKINKVS